MTAVIIIISVLIAAADQIIKYFVYQNLAPNGRVTVIENFLTLIYTENRGVAFGMFQNMQWLFVILTAFLMGIMLYVYISGKLRGKLYTTALILVVGGGIGNMIDRIFRGFVIDYLSVSFFPPICNFADYCITVGAVFFILAILMMSPESIGEGKSSEKKASDGETNGK